MLKLLGKTLLFALSSRTPSQNSSTDQREYKLLDCQRQRATVTLAPAFQNHNLKGGNRATLKEIVVETENK